MRLHAAVARAGTRLVVLAALASSLDAQTADTSALRRNPISMFGLPGLVQVPSAFAMPSGTVDFTFDGARTPSVMPDLGQQRNAFLAFGVLPWLTVSARGTVASYSTGFTERRDLSANVQLHLLDEHASTPALAAGVQDVGQGATPFFTSRYLVASKTLPGNATVSLGYGSGTHFLSGLFGGIGVGLGSWATALGEYDGHAVNGGLRVTPFPGFADRIGIQPRLDVVWRQGVGGAVGAGFRTFVGGKAAAPSRPASTPRSSQPSEPAATALARVAGTRIAGARIAGARIAGARIAGARIAGARVADVGGPTCTGADEAQRRLVALGFENVQVSIDRGDAGSVMSVDYENRRYNRDELDALGVVMGVTALCASAAVPRMRVTIRRVDLPVMTVESGIGAFLAFVNDRLSEASFANQLTFVDPPRAERARDAASAFGNPSRWKLDVFVRPRAETQLLSDFGVVDWRVTALADAYVQLAPGLVLNARRGFPVVRTAGFWAGIDDPNADRLLLHQAMRVPLGESGSSASAITQFTVGRFGHEAVGFSNETDVSLADGRFSLGSTLGVFGATFGTIDHTVALGTARMRVPAWDVTTSVTAGRFRNGDTGGEAELARQFGATELAFYLRSTEFASAAGFRLSLPLTPARELPPSRVRLRLPDVYVQQVQHTVLDPEAPLRNDEARLLDTDHEIARVYRTRDRLYPVTVARHTERLRTAARRWLGAEIIRE